MKKALIIICILTLSGYGLLIYAFYNNFIITLCGLVGLGILLLALDLSKKFLPTNTTPTGN